MIRLVFHTHHESRAPAVVHDHIVQDRRAPSWEEDEWLAREFLERDLSIRFESVALGENDHQGVTVNLLHHQGRVVNRQTNEPHVEATLEEAVNLLRGTEVMQIEANIAMGLRKDPNYLGEAVKVGP